MTRTAPWVIDAHCHVSDVWYEPVEPLLRQMETNAVDRAILIQLFGCSDNRYLQACVARHPGRLASVVHLDANSPHAARMLEELADSGIAGVRLRPTDRSPEGDPLSLWKTAERLGLAVSCGGRAQDFASRDFRDLLRAVPRLRIAIEHLGHTNEPNEPLDLALRKRVFAMACHPNVYVKVHGLGEFARRALPIAGSFPFEQPIPPLLEMACETFGPERMMWGSDFPPVSGREGYANALRLTMAALGFLSPSEQQHIFRHTAGEFFSAAEPSVS